MSFWGGIFGANRSVTRQGSAMTPGVTSTNVSTAKFGVKNGIFGVPPTPPRRKMEVARKGGR